MPPGDDSIRAPAEAGDAGGDGLRGDLVPEEPRRERSTRGESRPQDPKARNAETTRPDATRFDPTRGDAGPAFSRVLGLLAAPLVALVWLYRKLVSPVLPPSCRYYPSCASYAQEALLVHGPFRGLWLSLRRLLSCHPFCAGGLDPVPPRHPARPRST